MVGVVGTGETLETNLVGVAKGADPMQKTDPGKTLRRPEETEVQAQVLLCYGVAHEGQIPEGALRLPPGVTSERSRSENQSEHPLHVPKQATGPGTISTSPATSP